MRLKMKVAGSSWSLWWLLLCNCAGLLFGALVLEESSNVGQCEPLDSQTQPEFDHEDNLIEELASASQDTGKVPSLLGDVLKSYDATPFWYNLIQAISLASGITPTTEALMHDLVTSSFSSDDLNGSIKKVLNAIKCNESKTDGDAKQDAGTGDAEDKVPDSEGSDGGMTLGDTVSGAALEDHLPPQPPQFANAQEWNPWDRVLAALWRRELETSGNDLIGPLPGIRLRRELRDRRRGGSAMADLHQPFFMSEVVPSSLVTRHPSIISVSGCPSGHIQDLRGMCRQIFQYTVNYGGNSGSAPSSPLGRTGSGERRRRPWLFGGRRPSPQPVGGSLRDVARESSLFKHSVMRGYVPPLIFPQSSGARNLQARLGLNSRPPQPSVISNSVDGAAQESSGNSLVPSPVELMKTAPKIVLMEDDGPSFPPPPSPSSAPLPQLPSLGDSRTERRDDNLIRRGEGSGGGGSSESFDSSNSRSRDEKRREEDEKAAKKAREKYQSTTNSNTDDDD